MCKIVIFTNFRKVNDNKEVINYIANKLLETETDGFGYTIQGKKGAYGEKYIGKNVDFEVSIGINKPKTEFYSLPFLEKNREVFGVPSKSNGGALFHGRISTNKSGLKNTHPINKHGWSLIHNGVVTDHGPKYTMITDNDTEHVLERLATGGIDALTEHLTGYYAVGAFDPKGNLHIVRDNIAWLYCAKIEELDTYLFATTAKLIEGICETFGYERSTIELVKADSYMVFNTTGDLKSFKKIETRGYGHKESSLMSKSLSYMGDDMPFKEHYDNITDMTINDLDMQQMADYEAYRLEVDNCIDDTYQVLDYSQRRIKIDVFKKLDQTSQDECTIIRPDGTLLTYEDYHTDRLASDYMPSKGDMY